MKRLFLLFLLISTLCLSSCLYSSLTQKYTLTAAEALTEIDNIDKNAFSWNGLKYNVTIKIKDYKFDMDVYIKNEAGDYQMSMIVKMTGGNYYDLRSEVYIKKNWMYLNTGGIRAKVDLAETFPTYFLNDPLPRTQDMTDFNSFVRYLYQDFIDYTEENIKKAIVKEYKDRTVYIISLNDTFFTKAFDIIKAAYNDSIPYAELNSMNVKSTITIKENELNSVSLSGAVNFTRIENYRASLDLSMKKFSGKVFFPDFSDYDDYTDFFKSLN